MSLEKAISSCEHCPRLREHCREIARVKRKSFREETYWGKPVAGFGDPQAELVLVGLAPAAHGANRTGRVFTGDRSGDWLYRALYEAGFANQAAATARNDGLELRNARILCAVRCAPPENKPTPEEFGRCRDHLRAELDLLPRKKAFIALGALAAKEIGIYLGAKIAFGHGKETRVRLGRLDRREGRGARDGQAADEDEITVLCSFHPSQQNTFTGKLTKPMFDAVFRRARTLLAR